MYLSRKLSLATAIIVTLALVLPHASVFAQDDCAANQCLPPPPPPTVNTSTSTVDPAPPPVCPFNFQADRDQPNERAMPAEVKFQIRIDGTWFDIRDPDAPNPDNRDAWVNLERRVKFNEALGEEEVIRHGSAVMDCDTAVEISEDNSNIRAVSRLGNVVNGWFSDVGFAPAFHRYVQ